MHERASAERARRVGRCAACRHARVIVSAKQSEFWLCGRSSLEPTRYAKYPPLPVRECGGFELAEAPRTEAPSEQSLVAPRGVKAR
jgi:hypothetical protein